MPTTPEPSRTRARTPPTPMHGPEYDNYEPYSPRRSTRSSAQSNPYSSLHSHRSPPSNHLQRLTTPPPTITKKTRFASLTRAPTQLSSPPSSPASPVQLRNLHKTPRKHSKPSATNGALSDSDHALPSSSSLLPSHTTLDPNTMLPTPSKTPNKKRNAIHTTGRVLSFQPNHPNDVMPPSHKIKKHSRLNSKSMIGFELYEEEREAQRTQSDIPIYTDANARVPEVDEAEDNPFIGRRRTRVAPRRGKGRTAEQEEMMEAQRREEGVVYVFRGKKIFRRFSSNPDSEHDSNGISELSADLTPSQRALKRQAGPSASRPLTRSAMKPRLLFPSEEQLREREEVDEEEAVTDIEMPNADTPVKSHFGITAPTPPTSTRATRSKKVDMNHATPIPEVEEVDDGGDPMSLGSSSSFTAHVQAKAKGVQKSESPFDEWQRTKGKGRKRSAGDVEVKGGGKRTRGGTTAAVGRSPA